MSQVSQYLISLMLEVDRWDLNLCGVVLFVFLGQDSDIRKVGLRSLLCHNDEILQLFQNQAFL